MSSDEQKKRDRDHEDRMRAVETFAAERAKRIERARDVANLAERLACSEAIHYAVASKVERIGGWLHALAEDLIQRRERSIAEAEKGGEK